MYREDYSQAGYRMLPRFDLDSRFTRAEIVIFTLLLILATLLPGRGAWHHVHVCHGAGGALHALPCEQAGEIYLQSAR